MRIAAAAAIVVCGATGLAVTIALAPAPSPPPPTKAARERAYLDNLGLFANDFDSGLKAHSHGGFYPADAYKGELLAVIITFNNGVSAGMLVNSKFKANQIHLEMGAAVREAGAVPAD
jgi:hypothetical protein